MGSIVIHLRAIFLIAPILLIITMVNFLVRLVLEISFKFRQSRPQLVTGMDNFSKLSPSGIILVTLVLEKPESGSDLRRERELFQKYVLEKDGGQTYGKFKMVWNTVCGYGCWTEDSNFNVAKHVKFLEQERKQVLKEEELFDKILPSLTEEMDEDRPPWEWLLLDNVEISGVLKSVRILRFHHSLMDGASVGILFRDIFEFPTNSDDSIFVVNPFTPLGIKGRLAKALQIALIPFRLPLYISKMMEMTPQEGWVDPLSMPENQGKIHMSYSKPCPTSLFRKIKNRREFKNWSSQKIINTALTSTLRRFILEDDKLAGNCIRICTTIAIPPIPNYKPRNKFAFLSCQINLKSGIEEVGTLEACPENVFLLHYFQNWMNLLPINLLGKILAASTTVFESSYFSNVPFTRVKGRLWGRNVEEIIPFIPLYPTMGIALAATAYGNSFRLSGVVDDKFLDKRERLKELLDAVVDTVQGWAVQN